MGGAVVVLLILFTLQVQYGGVLWQGIYFLQVFPGGLRERWPQRLLVTRRADFKGGLSYGSKWCTMSLSHSPGGGREYGNGHYRVVWILYLARIIFES